MALNIFQDFIKFVEFARTSQQIFDFVLKWIFRESVWIHNYKYARSLKHRF